MSMAEELLLAIGEGRLSVATAARIAEARCREPGPDADALALARCTGSMGERTLHRWARRQPWRALLPEPYEFEAPLRVRGTRVSGKMQCLLPHEVLHSLSAAQGVFEDLFGTAVELEQFWAGMATCAEAPSARGRLHAHWLQSHPAMDTPASRRVPIGIHGDQGEMKGSEKVLVLSWGGLCRKGSTLDARILFAVLKASECTPDRGTWFAAFDVWRWSFQALAAGFYPMADEHGRPFARDHDPQRAATAGQPIGALEPAARKVGAWAELRGDWEFLRDALQLPQHYSTTRMCHLCGATKGGELDFAADFGRNAPCRATMLEEDVPTGPGGPAGASFRETWPFLVASTKNRPRL